MRRLYTLICCFVMAAWFYNASAQTVGLTASKVHHKYVEASNVQVADEMVNLIVAQRAYEMNSKVIQASDEMLQQANNLRG